MAALIGDPARTARIAALAQSHALLAESSGLDCRSPEDVAASVSAMTLAKTASPSVPKLQLSGRDTFLRDWPLVPISPENAVEVVDGFDKDAIRWLPCERVNVSMLTAPHAQGGWDAIPLVDIVRGVASWAAIPATLFELPSTLEPLPTPVSVRRALTIESETSEDASSESAITACALFRE